MRVLSTLALAALLSSCATHSAPPADGFDPAMYDGAPLRARIVNSGGRLMVSTSRPAHVAIFEIVPGRGVGLLYPAFRGERNYLQAGLNSVFLSQSRSYYSYFQSGGFFNSPSGEGPRYLYMIASDSPLRLSSFLSAPGALRRELGVARFASGNPYGLMEDLSGLVLSYGAPGDWTEDVYVVWPDRSYGTGGYSGGQWIRVRCPDGRVIEGPAYYVYGACARPNSVPPVRENPEPGDSSAVRPPTRRRPEPRDPGAVAAPPQVVEVLPEPEPARRPRVWTHGQQSADTPRDSDTESPRVERRSEPVTRVEPQVERRSEPAPRQEPRVERSEPRSEPAPQTPRAETPRAETPRAASPRVESARPEPRVVTPPSRR